jgi:hypothetical protein
MRFLPVVRILGLFLLSAALAGPVIGQADVDPARSTSSSPALASSNGRALNLTAGTVGVSIGDSKRTTGLRLNYRDRRLQVANGINLTLWRPYDEAGGVVNGVALGLPLTGGTHIRGLATGLFGAGAYESLSGAGLAPIVLGAGRHINGIYVAGVGAGAGGNVRGVAIGGIGAGGGEEASGILVGGLGAGAGGRATGLVLGGLGAGAGEDARGLVIGGLGAGAGENMTGITVGLIGAGAGGSARGLLAGGVGAGAGNSVQGVALSLGAVGAGNSMDGIAVGGLAAGAGNRLRGLTAGGLGAGASTVEGVMIGGLGAGAENLTGASIAGGYVRLEGGVLRGASVAGWNDIRGRQRGLTIGLYNYARDLAGIQIGLLNVARNNPPGLRALPFVNANL